VSNNDGACPIMITTVTFIENDEIFLKHSLLQSAPAVDDVFS
jgi:hypothetical protein